MMAQQRSSLRAPPVAGDDPTARPTATACSVQALDGGGGVGGGQMRPICG